jgi:CheY-like chemotaxis protein
MGVDEVGWSMPSPWNRIMRILVVDDHHATLDVMARLLRKLGHETLLAGTVQEAMPHVDAASFDLMISDLTLPDGTGEELMRAVKDKCGVPGIALSGYGESEDIQRSHEAGFQMHLVKPLSLTSLQSAIETISPPSQA